jgi:hypothetical protein
VYRVRSLAFAEEWIDASGEGYDAGGARSPTFDVCRSFKRAPLGLASSTVRVTIARFQSLGLRLRLNTRIGVFLVAMTGGGTPARCPRWPDPLL